MYPFFSSTYLNVRPHVMLLAYKINSIKPRTKTGIPNPIKNVLNKALLPTPRENWAKPEEPSNEDDIPRQPIHDTIVSTSMKW